MRHGRVLTFLMVLLAVAAQAVAQQGSAELRGRLVDNTGGALPGGTACIARPRPRRTARTS
jgi:hypothetical protein